MEGDAVPLDEWTEGVVVGDDAGDFAVEIAAAESVEKIGEAVVLRAHQDDHPLLSVGVR
jgi:hypothetical protein